MNHEDSILKREEAYAQIAGTLARQYDIIYYVDSETDEYTLFASNVDGEQLKISEHGQSFFEEAAQYAMSIAHPEDQELVRPLMEKSGLLQLLEQEKNIDLTYRVNYGTEYEYINIQVMWTYDHKHLIVGLRNVDKSEQNRIAQDEKNKLYADIASALSRPFQTIYYVDVKSNNYVLFTSSKLCDELGIALKGDDFFTDCAEKALKIILPEDRSRVRASIQKENMLQTIERNGFVSFTTQIKQDGVYVYTNLQSMWVDNHEHIIIAMSNVDKQVRQEQEQKRILRNMQEKAMTDGLTGVKNKNSFDEYVNKLQKEIDQGVAPSFAMVVCDLNGLKQVNDSSGHLAGDEYICLACAKLCQVYSHSPIFRIGGDEFVVLLRGHDYDHRYSLINALYAAVSENRQQNVPILAAGMADYLQDTSVLDVFQRADNAMYQNKRLVKGLAIL